MNEFLVKVIVADDHPVTGHGIADALGGASTIEVVAIAADTSTLIEKLDTLPCDVLVLDYVMPAGQYGDGLTLLAFLRRRYPQLRYVTVTMLNSPTVFRALRKIGAQCICSKSDALSHLVGAVHAAYSNGQYLSPSVASILEKTDGGDAALSQRESEIVRLFREGYKVSEIAEKLHRSKKTISAQKLSAMRKLGITRDADLIRDDAVLGVPGPDDASPGA
jgi:two-component system capsular synthesis response regulator RcsB